mmetsp:Transcript_37614/g.117206  ORF Transcript_37614/g.117206 Transcript_37614/m.117206 type:complete len:188 (+) Transcript_37614:42-605(+)
MKLIAALGALALRANWVRPHEAARTLGAVTTAKAEVSTLATHTLRQYYGSFCHGTYVALELQFDMMTKLVLPASRGVVCNELRNGTNGSYVVDSCVGEVNLACPTSCNCPEDMVKHFSLNECSEGWMLVPGAAASDCGQGNKECLSKNRVDVGLARWCSRWPTAALAGARGNDTVANASSGNASASQ